MYSTTARAFKTPNKVDAYLATRVMSATPEQLLIMLYDFAIVNCQKKDIDKVSRALTELIGTLNFEYEDIALNLFRLYQYCLDLVKKQSFDDACAILKELRDTWEMAFTNLKQTS